MEFPFPAHLSGTGREKRELGIRFILYRKSIGSNWVSEVFKNSRKGSTNEGPSITIKTSFSLLFLSEEKGLEYNLKRKTG